jgi:hypothetical protein
MATQPAPDRAAPDDKSMPYRRLLPEEEAGTVRLFSPFALRPQLYPPREAARV